MADTLTADNPINKIPTTEQFKTVVTQQLDSWSQENVEGLCFTQTESVIHSLAPYYHYTVNEDTIPEVVDFKKAIATFQLQKERSTFAGLTDPELTELVVMLIPYFHEATVEKVEADNNVSDV